MRTPLAAPRRDDAGYTLAEVMVVVLIMGIIAFLGAGSFQKWALASAHKGTSVDMQTVLRQTHIRAITEGVSFCVSFDTTGGTYTVSRYACETATVKVSGPYAVNDPRVLLVAPQFLQRDGTTLPAVTFRPTGSASPGTVSIRRVGQPQSYTLAVEGFTGRVSFT